MMRKAEILLHDRPVGVLEELDRGYRFTYSAAYLNDPKAVSASLTLPLRAEPFEDKRLFPFFDGLIPEGWLLEIAEKTWKIAELYEQKTGEVLRLNFDFSHFAVVKHLYPPYASRLLDRPDLLRASSQIHLRPFNGHHCEIPITDSHGKISGWAASWFEFVKDTLTCWSEGKSASDTLWACPELGSMTSGYWIPSFTDPWKDTIVAKQAIEEIWEKI